MDYYDFRWICWNCFRNLFFSLSEKQKEYLEDHFENDLSLSEIAKIIMLGQAIYDNIKRGVALLYDYEDKLKFFIKWERI